MMIRRFKVLDTAAGPREPQAPPTSIESWLAVFARLLRLPDEQKQAIRDELEQHLQERVRDLMLAGVCETDALRRAVDELGSAAELAERLRIANRPPTRRLVMSYAAIGTGVVGVVAATLLVSSTGRPTAVFYEPPTTVTDDRGGVR